MEVVISKSLNDELSGDVTFGGETTASGFRAEIGDAPMATPLGEFRASLGINDSDSPLLGRFELLLVPHRFSLIKTGGFADIVNVGVRVSYEFGEMTCSVVSLLPEYEFVRIADLTFEATVSSKGEASFAPPREQECLRSIAIGSQLRGILRGDASIMLCGSVVTPRIQAVGKGSRRCEWQFMLDKEPLYGRDIETWTILAVPANIQTFRYKLVLNVTQRTAFIPNRWESDSHEIICVVAR